MDPEACTHCGAKILPEAIRCADCGKPPFGDDSKEVEPDAPPPAEYHDLTPVFTGSMGEVTALRTALATQGHTTYIKDEHTKIIDPFITGGNVLAVTLLAPVEEAETVLGAIEQTRSSREARAGDATDDDAASPSAAEGPKPPDDEDADESTPTDMEVLGRRICWAALLMITAPIGLLLYAEYAAARRARPSRRRVTGSSGPRSSSAFS